MTRWTAVSVFCVVLAGTGPAPILAQTALYLLTPPPAGCSGSCLGTVTRLDPDVPAVVSSVAVPAPLGFGVGLEQYVTPDGRLLVWLGSDQSGARHLALHDLPASQSSLLAAPPAARAIVGHPHRAEVFLADAAGPVAWSPAGTHQVPHACAGAGSFPLTISADGRRVLYACDTGSNLPQVLVVDTTAYAAVGTRPWGTVTPALGRDGRDLYLVTGGRLYRYDTDSGALLVDVPVPTTFAGRPEGVGVVRVDPHSGRVFAIGLGVHVFDGVTLQHQWSSSTPWTSAIAQVTSWTFDPAGPRAFASWVEPLPAPRILDVRPGYAVIDTATGATLVQAIGSYGEIAGTFVVAASPESPTALTGTVTGARVDLGWTPAPHPAAVTRYLLEVGSAPGLNDIFAGLDVGLQASFAASGVPPGTYYVRVRAGNYTGLSTPSNELAVQVP